MNRSKVSPVRAPWSSCPVHLDLRLLGRKTFPERREAVFFTSKKKKKQEDLNQTLSKYRRWWQNQTEESPLSRSFKANKKSSESPIKAREARKVLDDSFVYYEGN
jgi:hypothetical protein